MRPASALRQAGRTRGQDDDAPRARGRAESAGCLVGVHERIHEVEEGVLPQSRHGQAIGEPAELLVVHDE